MTKMITLEEANQLRDQAVKQARHDWARQGSGPLREELARVEAERDALAAHAHLLDSILFDTFAAIEDGETDALPYDNYRSAHNEKPAHSLARRDAEQFRQGFWWGFERARCHPDQTNIRAEYEDVQDLRRRQAEQADMEGKG